MAAKQKMCKKLAGVPNCVCLDYPSGCLGWSEPQAIQRRVGKLTFLSSSGMISSLSPRGSICSRLEDQIKCSLASQQEQLSAILLLLKCRNISPHAELESPLTHPAVLERPEGWLLLGEPCSYGAVHIFLHFNQAQ